MNIRHLIVLVLTTFISYPAFNQVSQQGNFMMGGTMGFSTSESSVKVSGDGLSIDNEGTRTLQFNITPSIGYFLANNWALGISMDYTLNRLREPADVQDPDTEYERSYDSDLLFGPFTRLYLPLGINNDKAFFLEASAGFGSSQNETNIGGEDQTISNSVFLVGVGPGFTIYSTDAIGIEALAKYNWARSNADITFQGINTETTTYTNQIDFSIGIQVYFSRVQPASTDIEKNIGDDDSDADFY